MLKLVLTETEGFLWDFLANFKICVQRVLTEINSFLWDQLAAVQLCSYVATYKLPTIATCVTRF